MTLAVGVMAGITLVQLIVICLLAARVQELENQTRRQNTTIRTLKARLRERN